MLCPGRFILVESVSYLKYGESKEFSQKIMKITYIYRNYSLVLIIKTFDYIKVMAELHVQKRKTKESYFILISSCAIASILQVLSVIAVFRTTNCYSYFTFIQG